MLVHQRGGRSAENKAQAAGGRLNNIGICCRCAKKGKMKKSERQRTVETRGRSAAQNVVSKASDFELALLPQEGTREPSAG